MNCIGGQRVKFLGCSTQELGFPLYIKRSHTTKLCRFVTFYATQKDNGKPTTMKDNRFVYHYCTIRGGAIGEGVRWRERWRKRRLVHQLAGGRRRHTIVPQGYYFLLHFHPTFIIRNVNLNDTKKDIYKQTSKKIPGPENIICGQRWKAPRWGGGGREGEPHVIRADVELAKRSRSSYAFFHKIYLLQYLRKPSWTKNVITSRNIRNTSHRNIAGSNRKVCVGVGGV